MQLSFSCPWGVVVAIPSHGVSLVLVIATACLQVVLRLLAVGRAHCSCLGCFSSEDFWLWLRFGNLPLLVPPVSINSSVCILWKLLVAPVWPTVSNLSVLLIGVLLQFVRYVVAWKLL